MNKVLGERGVNFREYARKFVEDARRHGARPVLYMTWEYDRLSWISNPDETYLAACVVYSTLFNADPTRVLYVPSEVAPKDAEFLQRIAWQTVNSDWMY